MDNALIIWGLIALGLAYWLPKNMETGNPLFLSMEKEWKQVTAKQYIGTFQNPDTLLEHELYLLTGEKEQPLLFHSEIQTPVCIDGICKPVEIVLYWSLVGSYVGYGIREEKPLTKFDHDEFLAIDYQKLHQLLVDKNSVFKRRTLEELFDKNGVPEKQVTYQGVEVDAVSGATKKEIKESVVEGALYSCYTLWHLVHGNVKGKMEAYLDTIYSEELERYFLDAEYPDYQFHALKQLDTLEYGIHAYRIAEIFETAKPLTRAYILKKMPKELWKKEELSQYLYQAFSTVDITSRTLLIKNLRHAHHSALEILSTQIEEMTKNHLKSYLKYLLISDQVKNEILQENLTQIANSEEYAYSYLIQEFLN